MWKPRLLEDGTLSHPLVAALQKASSTENWCKNVQGRVARYHVKHKLSFMDDFLLEVLAGDKSHLLPVNPPPCDVSPNLSESKTFSWLIVNGRCYQPGLGFVWVPHKVTCTAAALVRHPDVLAPVLLHHHKSSV